MYYERQDIAIVGGTSAGSYYSTPLLGDLYAVSWTGTLQSTATLTITNEKTAAAVLTLARGSGAITRYPRTSVVTTTGGTVINTTATGGAVRDYVPFARDRLKVVRSAVASSTGSLTLTVVMR